MFQWRFLRARFTHWSTFDRFPGCHLEKGLGNSRCLIDLLQSLAREPARVLDKGDELVAVADLWVSAVAEELQETKPRWQVLWTNHPPLT